MTLSMSLCLSPRQMRVLRVLAALVAVAVVLTLCACAGPSTPNREIDLSAGGTNSGYGLTVSATGQPNSEGVQTDVVVTFTATKPMTVDMSMSFSGYDGDPNLRSSNRGFEYDNGAIHVPAGTSVQHIYPQNYGWTTATGAPPHTYNSLTGLSVTLQQQ